MENGSPKVKMSGYLFLKIKKRMRSSWKNYWFVLEDRLLLYYRSKAEYEAISPCKGSINLGPPCAVKSIPSVANSFQIVTRTVSYTLKTDHSDDQKKWIQILLSVLNQNQNFNPETPKRLSHFRYSLDNLVPEVEACDPHQLERQNTMPKNNTRIIERLQKMGAHSYGGNLGAISKIATKRVASPTPDVTESLQDSQPEEVMCRVHGDNIYERISGDSQDSNRESFLVDNDNYSVPLRKSSSLLEEPIAVLPTRETKSLMIENDQYGVTRQVQSEEVIYSEPKVEPIDCNRNTVVVENSFYDSAHVVQSQNENLYEDLDNFSHYSQPIFNGSSQCSVDTQKQCEEKRLKKSKSFIKRMLRRKNRKEEKKDKDDEIYEEIDPKVVEKVVMTDDSAIQMLSELHNILENKKSKIKTSRGSPHPEDPITDPPPPTDSETVCPSLPPKTPKPPSKQPVPSLDEILEDLDKEKTESKSKVQSLIEKFNEPEPDVVLRKHRVDLTTYRHSDELNVLLDELAKVASAPIMTPGVTSSLVNPSLNDDEWLKLLPVRQRRLSDPDYDVPRLHKSIQLPTQSESDAIPATRFFGPVLPNNFSNNKEESLSMTPDSLEVEAQLKSEPQYSYTSHQYFENQKNHKCSPHNYRDDKIIYAMPKSYLSVATHVVNTCQNICGAPMTEDCTVVYKSVKNVELDEEIFNDSLEQWSERSTEF